MGFDDLKRQVRKPVNGKLNTVLAPSRTFKLAPVRLVKIPARYLSHIAMLALVISVIAVGAFQNAGPAVAAVTRNGQTDRQQASLTGGYAPAPQQAPLATQAAVQAQPNQLYIAQRPRDSVITYVAQPGDTVQSLAEYYRIDEETIRQANNLTGDQLQAGKQVIILPVSGMFTTVRPGDTLGSLARLYDTEARAILQYNAIVDPNNLVPGTKLVIPGGHIEQTRSALVTRGSGEADVVQAAVNPAPAPAPVAAPAAAPAPAPAPAPAVQPQPQKQELRVYTVQPGDTINSIAQQFGLTLQTMLVSNNLSADSLITPGQLLWILPVDGLLHTVAPGDTLNEIASRYQANPERIIEVNNLSDPSLLKPGSWVVVPDGKMPVVQAAQIAEEPEYTTLAYEVQEGDTLHDIAEHFGVNTGSILQANGIEDAELIRPGEMLEIPGADPQASTSWERSTVTAAPKAAAAPAPKTAPAAVASQPAAPAPAPAPKVVTNTSRGTAIANLALQYRGYPYVFGGTSPYGFDCSGFTSYIYSRAYGIYIGRDTWAQWRSGTPVSQSQLLPGDLVFFDTYASISHVGIYIGGGMMINAQSESVGVNVVSIYSSYWGPRYAGARRPW